MENNDKKTIDQFTKEEIDIGDIAYVETMENIRRVVGEYLDKEEIKFAVWEAARDGMKDFLEEYYDDIIKELIDGIKDSFNFNININKGKK